MDVSNPSKHVYTQAQIQMISNFLNYFIKHEKDIQENICSKQHTQYNKSSKLHKNIVIAL